MTPFEGARPWRLSSLYRVIIILRTYLHEQCICRLGSSSSSVEMLPYRRLQHHTHTPTHIQSIYACPNSTYMQMHLPVYSWAGQINNAIFSSSSRSNNSNINNKKLHRPSSTTDSIEDHSVQFPVHLILPPNMHTHTCMYNQFLGY